MTKRTDLDRARASIRRPRGLPAPAQAGKGKQKDAGKSKDKATKGKKIAAARVDKDANGFPVIRNQQFVDNRYQVCCPVCTSNNAYMRIRRAKTVDAHHYYVVQCADCETFSHLKTDKATAAYRAWNTAYRNPQIAQQIRGMLATFIRTQLDEDERLALSRRQPQIEIDDLEAPEYTGEDILDGEPTP